MKMERREFLRRAAVLGAGTVIAIHSLDLGRIFAEATEDGRHVVWLQGATDSGCTISLLQGVSPDLVDVIRNFRLSVDFHPNLMVPAGNDAAKALQNAAADTTPLDLLIVEGAIPKGNYCTVGEVYGSPVSIEDWVRALGTRAKNVVAVGTCAAYGGIPAANPNPTMCRSASQVLAGKGVINIPGCPPHPDWVTLALAAALSGEVIQLDSMGRPVAIFRGAEDGEEGDDDGRIHEHCKLKESYEDERFAADLGQEPLFCLYELGCKGKRGEVVADCTERLWNNRTNVCQYAGAPCIGCVAPTFPDGMSPFFGSPEHERGEEEVDD